MAIQQEVKDAIPYDLLVSK